MRRFVNIAALLAGLFVTSASAAGMGGVMVMHAQIAESIGAARTGAGYLVVMNHTDAADRLLRIEADFPRVEIHTTEMNDGVATMARQDNGVEVPAGGHLVLAPGGYHVMFMGLSTPFVEDAEVQAVAVFATAGRVEMTFTVVARDALQSVGDHEQLDHSKHGEADHDEN